MPVDLELIEAPPAAEKCEHGVRISPGDRIARYCSACNPRKADTVLAASMARRKPACRQHFADHETDVESFITQPVGARIAGAREFLDLEER